MKYKKKKKKKKKRPRRKGGLFGKIKSIFDNFMKVLF